jgi:hypothetical protein
MVSNLNDICFHLKNGQHADPTSGGVVFDMQSV